MPYITVTRSDEDMNKLGTFKVMIDDVKAETLENGDAKKIYVEPGTHTISIVVWWWGSKTLTFNAVGNEERTFAVGSNKTLGKVSAIIMLIAVLGGSVIAYIPMFLFLSVMAILVIISLRYSFVDRDQYLDLQCTDEVVEYTSTGAIF